MELADGIHGHRDWRSDELRLTAEGRVAHEIEWSGVGDTGRWLIPTYKDNPRLDEIPGA